METNLENNFRLAHRWNCVLLLDEADVFLGRRDKHDLKRNSMVSGEPWVRLQAIVRFMGADFSA